MQAQTQRAETAVLQQTTLHPALPRISHPTFEYCLNVLFVHTKVLASNVISLHLHLAGKTAGQQEGPLLLSRFQLDLLEQALEIQAHLAASEVDCPQPEVWERFAALWRIPNVSEVPKALGMIIDATDTLAELYESLLPLASQQHDQASSLYLMADHLDVLNSYLGALKDWKMLRFS